MSIMSHLNLPSLSPIQSVVGPAVKQEEGQEFSLPPTLNLSTIATHPQLPSIATHPQLPPIATHPQLPSLEPVNDDELPRMGGRPQSRIRTWFKPRFKNPNLKGRALYAKKNVIDNECLACHKKGINGWHINELKDHVRKCALLPQEHKGICTSAIFPYTITINCYSYTITNAVYKRHYNEIYILYMIRLILSKIFY